MFSSSEDLLAILLAAATHLKRANMLLRARFLRQISRPLLSVL